MICVKAGSSELDHCCLSINTETWNPTGTDASPQIFTEQAVIIQTRKKLLGYKCVSDSVTQMEQLFMNVNVHMWLFVYIYDVEKTHVDTTSLLCDSLLSRLCHVLLSDSKQPESCGGDRDPQLALKPCWCEEGTPRTWSLTGAFSHDWSCSAMSDGSTQCCRKTSACPSIMVEWLHLHCRKCEDREMPLQGWDIHLISIHPEHGNGQKTNALLNKGIFFFSICKVC